MGLEHVETQVANGDSTIDFTNVFDGSADRYLLYIDNYIPQTDRDYLSLRLSSDGGSTYDSGSSDYARTYHQIIDDGTTGSGGSSGDNKIIIVGNTGNDPSVNDTSMETVTFHEPENSNRATVVRGKASYYYGNFVSRFDGGERLTQSAIDSFRLQAQTDNISSGIFSVYAVTETSSGEKDHIETIEANSQSSVDFTSVFGANDGYDRYEIHCDNVIPQNDRPELYARYSSDQGSTWDSGTSDYAWCGHRHRSDGSTASLGSGGDSNIRLDISNLGNDPSNNDTYTGGSVISNPTNSNRATVIRHSGSLYVNGDGLAAEYSGGIRLAQSAIDSIQFFMSSGDIASGTFSVYGIGQ